MEEFGFCSPRALRLLFEARSQTLASFGAVEKIQPSLWRYTGITCSGFTLQPGMGSLETVESVLEDNIFFLAINCQLVLKASPAWLNSLPYFL